MKSVSTHPAKENCQDFKANVEIVSGNIAHFWEKNMTTEFNVLF